MTAIVQALLDAVGQLGYWGIMLGLMVEVIPSELVLAYGGYLVSREQLSFGGAVIFGTFGGTLAQLFLYWLGRYGGRPALEKYGRYVLIGRRQLDMSERWFKQYGPGVVFLARFVPVVRHAISIPAGMTRMPHVTFILYTMLAVIPWSILFVYAGMKLGGNWREIEELASRWLPPLVVAVVAGIAVYIWLHKRGGKSNGR